jgi:hypothetical protein
VANDLSIFLMSRKTCCRAAPSAQWRSHGKIHQRPGGHQSVVTGIAGRTAVGRAFAVIIAGGGSNLPSLRRPAADQSAPSPVSTQSAADDRQVNSKKSTLQYDFAQSTVRPDGLRHLSYTRKKHEWQRTH